MTNESSSSTSGQKLFVFAGAGVIVVSFLSLAMFIALTAFSLVTWSTPHFWRTCFVLCSASLAGWMLLYTGQLRIGGGVFLLRSNVLLLLALIFAVFVTAIVRFPGYQKDFALLALALALAAFHIAGGGILNPRILYMLLRNELPGKDVNA